MPDDSRCPRISSEINCCFGISRNKLLSPHFSRKKLTVSHPFRKQLLSPHPFMKKLLSSHSSKKRLLFPHSSTKKLIFSYPSKRIGKEKAPINKHYWAVLFSMRYQKNGVKCSGLKGIPFLPNLKRLHTAGKTIQEIK